MVSYDYRLNRQTKEEKKTLLSNSEGRRWGGLCLMFCLNGESSQPASPREAPVHGAARARRHRGLV